MEINNQKIVESSYLPNDCIFLLKDLTSIMPEVSIEEKEKLIAQGINYSEMISHEDFISDEVNNAFHNILNDKAKLLATYIGSLCKYLYTEKGDNLVICSLARAGTPVGVLMKRYFKYAFNKDIPHFSISIIRGKGIDENALDYIFNLYPNADISFVDGWTGKGSITYELNKSIDKYNFTRNKNIDNRLVVLADPAHKSEISGTKKDICIPNACLNSTVSGLVSRTIHNKNFVGENDFHGAKYFSHLEKQDVSIKFIDEVEKFFSKNVPHIDSSIDLNYVDNVISHLEKHFGTIEPTKVKLSIGETSRALLRRIPKIMLVKDINNPDLEFVLHMAKNKNVPIKQFDTMDYECISLLK